VVGRARTCNAPRFRRALYLLELRPRGWARLGSNQRPLVCKTSAHPAELLARVEHKWAELESNQRPPPYQRGALPLELPARAPGQGLEPRSPRSERGVLPLDDPRSARPHFRPPPEHGRSTQLRRPSLSRSAYAERCFPSHSPTLRPWIALGARPTWRSFGARASRSYRKKSELKHTHLFQRNFQRQRRGSFSLRRGLDFVLSLVQAEHHLWFRCG
jgi:hypothetical protein